MFAAFGILAAVVAAARAETATLEIKRLGVRDGTRIVGGRAEDYIYRTTSAQSFNAAVGPQGDSRVNFGGESEQKDAFNKLVTKEPKYESEYPFRGVVKLGSQQYPFVLDAAPEKKADGEKAKDGESKEAVKADEKKAKAGEEAADEKKADADADKSKDEAAEKEKETKKTPKAIRYNRLYFDVNHNGDLTDDKVLESDVSANALNGGNYAPFSFPQVDLTVDADGTAVEYSFSLSGYMVAQQEFSYAGVQLRAAAYREGDITLDGKAHHVALIDYNSNGRFDDEIKIQSNVRGSGGQVYPQQGDMLLVDPDPKSPDSPYNPAQSKFRNYVSKLVLIDGKYYDVKITPAGDKLTLEPTKFALGKVTNPNDGYSAVIYGDQGFVKIAGGKDQATEVPEGEWKLLSYSIDQTEPVEPPKPPEDKAKSDDKEEKKDDAKGSTPKALSSAIKGLLKSSAPAAIVNRRSTVSATATADYKPVKVVAGETVEMPFGPPYKPIVNSYPSARIVDGKQEQVTQLSLSLVGMAGEQCTDMIVKGGRPSKPEFSITDPDGKVVQTGNFEYG
jgi:hypothetical protein